jgi:2-methylisocitrate lyase-like PEP mutase family enzyme
VGQTDKARHFANLHVKGTPLLLYNAWDAGSAKAIRDAGAKAIATSSWSVAEAQGYRDGEAIPIGFVERIVGQIVATIDLPVTIDFEGGYNGEDDDGLASKVARLLDINFEDRVVKGSGLYDISRQAARIATLRETAEERASSSSSTLARTCFSARTGMKCNRSTKRSTGPKLMRPPERPASLFPA